jgi:hypothetical protein
MNEKDSILTKNLAFLSSFLLSFHLRRQLLLRKVETTVIDDEDDDAAVGCVSHISRICIG